MVAIVEVGFEEVAEGSNVADVIPESVIVPDGRIKMIVNFFAGPEVVGVVIMFCGCRWNICTSWKSKIKRCWYSF